MNSYDNRNIMLKNVIGGGKRIAYLDYSRVFAALLVIYGHVLPYDNFVPRTYIYSFHMPFFFIVSGMLHKYYGYINWKKYFHTLIIPALFFNVVMWIVVAPFFYYGNWDYESRFHAPIPDTLFMTYVQTAIMGIKGIILGRGGAPSGPCWFLFALFFCKVGTDMLRKYGKKMLFLFMLLFVVCALKHKNLLCLGNAMMAMPFFLSGHYFGKLFTKYIEMGSGKFKACTALLLLVLTVLLTNFNGQVSMWGISWGHKWPLPVSFVLFHLNAFIGSFMLLLSASLFKSSLFLVTSLANSLITILGIQVFFIYCSWYDFPALTSPVPGLVISVVFLFGCHAIHFIIKHYIPFVLGK